jgi:hypothetical protein
MVLGKKLARCLDGFQEFDDVIKELNKIVSETKRLSIFWKIFSFCDYW